MPTILFTTKITSREHRLLIHFVERNTKIDGMGPFKGARTYSNYR